MPAVGSILQATPATYVNPYNYVLTGTTTAFTVSTITLVGGSETNDAYVGWALCYTNQANPQFNRLITAYDGATKIATMAYAASNTATTFNDTQIVLNGASDADGAYVGYTLLFLNQANNPTPRTITAYVGSTRTATLSGPNWGGYSPIAGTTIWAVYSWGGYEPVVGTTVWGISNLYPVDRRYQWIKDGADIAGAIGGSFTPYTAGSYQFRETAFYPNTSGLTTVTTSAAVTITGTRDASLVYADNLVWQGCFYAPALWPADELAYGGTIAYYEAGNSGTGSLFVRGLSNKIGEISIPAPGTTLGAVPTATLLNTSALVDPLEGQRETSGIISGGGKPISGLLVDGGKLIVTANGDYEVDSSASWFWRRPLNLSTTGAIEGPFSVTDAPVVDNPRYYAGYMASVPSSLQTKLGGPVVAGLTAMSVNSNTSNGPTYASFDPANFTSAASNVKRGAFVAATSNTLDLSSGPSMSATTNFYVGYWLTTDDGSSSARKITAYNGTTKVATVDSNWIATPTSGNWVLVPPVSAKALSIYTISNPLQVSLYLGYPYIWDDVCAPMGGYAIPNGTRSVLGFSQGGNNMFTYSSPDQFRYGVKTYDPTGGGTGEHNYPYFSRCWAYDANELEQARLGAVSPENVKPYAVWNFTMPILNGNGVNGAAYDPVNKRLFLTNNAGGFGRVVVHVYTVSNATYP